jgi:hypothetical protein
MNMKTVRGMIGFGILVMILALGTGWIVEKTLHRGHSGSGAATIEPAKPSDAVRPATTDQDIDRSDLILSQG